MWYRKDCTRSCWLTVNAGVCHQKSNVSQSDNNFCHVEDVGLTYFEGPPESNDTIEIYEGEWDTTEGIFAVSLVGGSFFVRLKTSAPCEFGVNR